jgi:hypothetical protein
MQTATISAPLEYAAGNLVDPVTFAEIEEVFTDIYIAPTFCLQKFELCHEQGIGECCPPYVCGSMPVPLLRCL